MIRVLLADDDYLVKDVLMNFVPWQELDMQVVGFAEDGQQALDLCLSLQPDVLVTDIKMPFLSGLDVALHLLENGMHTRVVLISGIQDFDYARTALDLRAAGYLLKPIRMKEVVATLKKVRETIEAESNREEVLTRIQRRLEENIPLAKDRFLCNLVHGELDSPELLPEKLHYFSLAVEPTDDVVVVVAQIDSYSATIAQHGERQTQMLNFTVRDVISQAMENYLAGLSVMPRDNEFVCIFYREYCSANQMELVLEAIQELVARLASISLTFGVGLQVPGLAAAHTSYRSALKALDYKFYTGSHTIIDINDMSDAGMYSTTVNQESSSRLHVLRKGLLRLCKLGDSVGIQQDLEECNLLLTHSGVLSQEYVRGQFLEMIIHAYRDFCESEGDSAQTVAQYNQAMQIILRAETALQIMQSTLDFLLYLSDFFGTKYNSRNKTLVEQIKAYIDQNYRSSISLADIAGAVFMSPNYICAVFKNETGHTINEYLLAAKVNGAKKLLRNTNMKILEIASALGYESPHYFSYSFKHYTGKTPQQYRKVLGV